MTFCDYFENKNLQPSIVLKFRGTSQKALWCHNFHKKTNWSFVHNFKCLILQTKDVKTYFWLSFAPRNITPTTRPCHSGSWAPGQNCCCHSRQWGVALIQLMYSHFLKSNHACKIHAWLFVLFVSKSMSFPPIWLQMIFLGKCRCCEQMSAAQTTHCI